MEKQIAELNGKIKTLALRVNKTDEILRKDDRVALERHKTSLESMVTAVNDLKEYIEEKMQQMLKRQLTRRINACDNWQIKKSRSIGS